MTRSGKVAEVGWGGTMRERKKKVEENEKVDKKNRVLERVCSHCASGGVTNRPRGHRR